MPRTSSATAGQLSPTSSDTSGDIPVSHATRTGLAAHTRSTMGPSQPRHPETGSGETSGPRKNCCLVFFAVLWAIFSKIFGCKRSSSEESVGLLESLKTKIQGNALHRHLESGFLITRDKAGTWLGQEMSARLVGNLDGTDPEAAYLVVPVPQRRGVEFKVTQWKYEGPTLIEKTPVGKSGEEVILELNQLNETHQFEENLDSSLISVAAWIRAKAQTSTNRA
ncbi:MAG: hypothetical protein JSS32_03740 [Verrucomicrobia bacterium]|nr:hypothetical protein [Verrucomicrobiota bacterium]